MLDLIKDNNKIIVATSGGPDSMFLLNELVKVQKVMNLSLVVAHVNHNTRVECDDEARFVKDFCEKHSLVFELLKIKKYVKGHFTEGEARNIRINFFKELINKYHYDYVVTAHHADDLMETILMKLIRGSTLDAISGIKMVEVIDGVVFKRPLLFFSKNEIFDGLKKDGVSYCIDYTNYQESHLRNRIRKRILPVLKQEDVHVDKKFLKFSVELQEMMEYLNRKLDIINKDINKDYFIDLKKFNALELFIKKEYLKKIFKEIYGVDVVKLNEKNYFDVINYLGGVKRKNYFDLPCSYIVEVNKDFFHIVKKVKHEDFFILCTDMVLLKDGVLLKKDSYGSKSNFEIHLSLKDVVLPLYLTNRKPGMRMVVKNMNGSKKVKDILIDEHVLPSEKDDVMIMVDACGKVLWILGLKKSQYDLDKNEKCDIIYKYERKELLK